MGTTKPVQRWNKCVDGKGTVLQYDVCAVFVLLVSELFKKLKFLFTLTYVLPVHFSNYNQYYSIEIRTYFIVK